MRSGAPIDPFEFDADAWLLDAPGSEAQGIAAASEESALLALSRAVAEQSGEDANPACLLGVKAMDNGDHFVAIGCFSSALKAKPDFALAFHLLGRCFRRVGRLASAMAAHRRACALEPANGDYWSALGGILHVAGQTAEAIEAYERAHLASGKAGPLIRAMTLVPSVYKSVEEIERARALLGEAIATARRMSLKLGSPVEEALHLFYLAYHGDDDRPLMEAMAQLIVESCEGASYVAPHLKRGEHRSFKRGKRRLRLALISNHFKRHTIGHLFRGLVEHFPRNDVEVLVFSLESGTDYVAERFQVNTDRFVPLRQDLDEARREIAKRKPDVLLYTDIGMEKFTYGLAFSRLAPVQCVTWGHPVTTGIPTIDYYLSAADLEIPGAEDFYSEELVRLNRIGCCYARPGEEIPERRREDFGLPAETPLYLCPQTSMKLHPEFDELLDGILRSDECGLVLLMKPGTEILSNTIKSRLERRLGPRMERVRFLAPLPRPEFLALMSLCQVMLDPLHFGGGNTNYEACHIGLPVVTLPGRFMRGRFAYALYRQMGVSETIATDKDDYIERAVRLANDPDSRAALSHQILSRSDCIFDDRTVLDELAKTFFELMQRAQSTPGSGIKGASRTSPVRDRRGT